VSAVVEMLDGGVRALARHRRLLVRLFLVELAASLVFAGGVAAALFLRFGSRPLFARGVAGDDAALASAILSSSGTFTALGAVGLAWVFGYALLSVYLGAGLLGAFAGRRFAEAAGERFGAFFRLWLWSLLPWAVALGVGALGFAALAPELEDALAPGLLVGRPLLALAPGLLCAAVVSCAVDYARARLALRGGGALKALGFGLGRALARPTALLHFLVYAGVWLGVSLAYLAGTVGVAFAGLGGAVLLFALRQLACALRFAARAAASAGQLRALQVEVLEVGELVERAEARGDVAGAEAAQPVE